MATDVQEISGLFKILGLVFWGYLIKIMILIYWLPLWKVNLSQSNKESFGLKAASYPISWSIKSSTKEKVNLPIKNMIFIRSINEPHYKSSTIHFSSLNIYPSKTHENRKITQGLQVQRIISLNYTPKHSENTKSTKSPFSREWEKAKRIFQYNFNFVVQKPKSMELHLFIHVGKMW